MGPCQYAFPCTGLKYRINKPIVIGTEACRTHFIFRSDIKRPHRILPEDFITYRDIGRTHHSRFAVFIGCTCFDE